MAALTSDRDTPRRDGIGFVFEAGEHIFAGAMVCLDAAGKLVPASATAGLTPVVGVAQESGDVGQAVTVYRGLFLFLAATGDAPGLPQVGTECFAADDQTVQKTQGGNAPRAGIVRDANDSHVWVEI